MAPGPPENLAASRELVERIGGATSTFFYGINVCLIIYLISAGRGTKFSWMNVATYTTFILTSLFQSFIFYVTIISSIHHPETSDSLSLWFGSSNSRTIQLVITTVALLNSWLLDAGMLYQCIIIYSIQKMELWVTGLPILFLFSSIGSGAYLIARSAGIQVQVLPHLPLCISTKLVATSYIAFKLLQQRRTMQRIQVENREELIRPYISLIRVLITSYALYSTFSSIFLGLNLLKVGAWRIFMPNATQAGLTSHLLVRFQVVRNNQDKPYDSEPIQFSTT